MQLLRDLVVVEVAGSVAGAYCGRMFASGGADVIVVGHRNLSPYQQQYYDDDKRYGSLDDIDLQAVDVIIESSAPDPLTPITIDAPQAVRVQISPFGMAGDRAGWRSTDLVDYALSGHSYLYGDPDREPLRGPPDQPAVASGLYGFIGAMAALLARDRIGGGQVVEVSHLQVMVALHQVTLLRLLMSGDVFCRMGNRYTGQGQPNGPYRCADGWVSIACVTTPQIEGLLAVTGLTHLLDRPDITSPLDFEVKPEVLDEPLSEWLSTHYVDDVVSLFQTMRIPTSPLLGPGQLLTDPQLAARDFFQPLKADPRLKIPGPPFTISHVQDRGPGAWQPGDPAGGPLAGLKVLDLARVWAGPLCARILSDLGADVVWLEAPWHRGPRQIPDSAVESSRVFPDNEAGDRPWNRNTHLVKYSMGKRSLAVDLQTDAGQAVFARLLPNYHVVLENFSTRVMPQFGFDEARLHQLNPDLIYLTMPGFGRSGPAEHWLAYGSTVDSHAGLSSLIGYPDATPWKGGIAWPDPVAGLHAAAATLEALWSGMTHGTGGLTIEGAQFESTVAAIGDRILEAQVDGPYVPLGNRERSFVAQGAYRCAGVDEWLAVSVPDDATWQKLCSHLGLDPSLRRDHDAFDTAMTAICADRIADAFASELQSVGIPAGKMAKSPDLMADPHLRSRQAWVTVDQPDVGEFTAPITPIALSVTMARRPTAAPTLGQHNEEVLAANGFSPGEIASLVESGTVVDAPPA